MADGLEDNARYQFAKDLADKIPGWADAVGEVPELLASNPAQVTFGAAGVVSLAGMTFAVPRLARRAARTLASDPSDLLVGRSVEGGLFTGSPPVKLPWADRRTGMRITGPTGSGKTTATVPFALDDLLAGRDVFHLETHGDLGSEVVKRARELGIDTYVCDASAGGSMYWNALAGENTEDVANRVAAAVASSLFYHGYYGPLGETIVRNFVRLAREYVELSPQTDCAEADWDLLTNLFLDSDFLHEVLQTSSEKGKPPKVGADWVSARIRAWFNGEFFALPETERHRNKTNVANLFEKLDNSRGAKRMLLPQDGRGELELYEMLNRPAGSRGRLIVVRAPVTAQGMGDSAAKTIAYLTFKTVIDATLAREAPAKPVKPLSIFLDEMPALIGQAGEETQSEVSNWLALVRDKNCAPVLVFQSHALMPPILRNALDATCRNFLVFGGSSADEVELIRRSSGITETAVEDSRTSYSRSGRTYSEGSRMAEKKRLSFDEVKYLGRGEAIFMGVRDNADELPVKVKTRRAESPEHYRRLRETAEAKTGARAAR